MERAYAVQGGEIYHASCFPKQYPNDEKQPEYDEVVPQADDECDYCAGLMIEPPDEDSDGDDFGEYNDPEEEE